MKPRELNDWLGVVTNLGVIAGLVLVAYEIQQNNELLIQESRYNMVQNQKDWSQFLTSDEQIFNLITVASGEELTVAENARRYSILLGNLQTWQWEWEQSRTGLLGTTDVPVQAFRTLWVNFKIERNWQQLRIALNPDFVKFMENEIAN